MTKRIKANGYKLHDKVRMTEDALKNYGEQYRGRLFEVSHIARNTKEHPGFDDCAGTALYDFVELPIALYEWEMEPA
jgi:hypothetical protein